MDWVHLDNWAFSRYSHFFVPRQNDENHKNHILWRLKIRASKIVAIGSGPFLRQNRQENAHFYARFVSKAQICEKIWQFQKSEKYAKKLQKSTPTSKMKILKNIAPIEAIFATKILFLKSSSNSTDWVRHENQQFLRYFDFYVRWQNDENHNITPMRPL